MQAMICVVERLNPRYLWSVPAQVWHLEFSVQGSGKMILHVGPCHYCRSGSSCVQVSRPDGKPDLLGLKVLDEPAAVQSDPAVLTMQLRQASKQASLPYLARYAMQHIMYDV